MNLLNHLELKNFVSFLIDPGEMYKMIPSFFWSKKINSCIEFFEFLCGKFFLDITKPFGYFFNNLPFFWHLDNRMSNFLISLYFSLLFHRKWVIKLNSYIGKSEKTEFNINQLLEIIVFLFNCKIKCILSAYLFSVFYLWQSLDNETQASTYMNYSNYR